LKLHGDLPLVAGEKITKALKLGLAAKTWVAGSFFQQKVLPYCGIIVDRVRHHNERTDRLMQRTLKALKKTSSEVAWDQRLARVSIGADSKNLDAPFAAYGIAYTQARAI
jgi:hypothetical protein